MLYLIEFDSTHWAGAPEYVLVDGLSAEDAEFRASNYMDEVMRELYTDEYGESILGDEEYADDCVYSVVSVEVFNENHPAWEFKTNFDKI